VKLVAILAFLTLIGAICGETTRRRNRPETNLEAERENEEEEWRIKVEQSLISQRNQAAYRR